MAEEKASEEKKAEKEAEKEEEKRYSGGAIPKVSPSKKDKD